MNDTHLVFPPSARLTAARAVARVLLDHGHEACFAGGCVRDCLLGLPPSDYDVATSATPDVVVSLFPHTVKVGAAFGVILVVQDHQPVEVATFRSEGAYNDGRHPAEIAFSTAEKDVLRRDFTINGLLAHPFTGEVSDHVGGLADLRAGLVRAIGDPVARFSEDRLRILRAIRFSARFSFPIEPGTWEAILRFATAIGDVSQERIREELDRILTGPHPAEGWNLLKRSGILAVVLPEAERMEGVEQNPEFHPEGDVWTHTLKALSLLEEEPVVSTLEGDPSQASSLLAWAVALHDVGKPPTAAIREDGRRTFYCHEQAGARMAVVILTRLRFPVHFIEDVSDLIADHMRLAAIFQMKDSTLKRLVGKTLRSWPDSGPMSRYYVNTLLRLHRIDCLASYGGLAEYDHARARIDALVPGAEKPPRLITGRDLLGMKVPRGPVYTELLKAVEDAQLNDELSTRTGALAFASAWLRERNLDFTELVDGDDA
ncbi:MAG: phosphohydrolase [Deltaproteobacteria bacterium HGW-Deltaproteobacteria-22]|nr:MAG: phosphohydrolase [Deltaproteobacteria bacterium HGW-Deltaproteobacteria-22]